MALAGQEPSVKTELEGEWHFCLLMWLRLPAARKKKESQ
jgi:hypothetical protein